MHQDFSVPYFYLIYSACVCPHSGAHHAALQCRTCCPRAAEKELLISDYQLSVGADIKENADFLLLVQFGIDHAADNITAKVIGFGWIAIDVPLYRNSQILRRLEARSVPMNCMRSVKYAKSIHSKEKMNHGSVSRNYHRNASASNTLGIRIFSARSTASPGSIHFCIIAFFCLSLYFSICFFCPAFIQPLRV